MTKSELKTGMIVTNTLGEELMVFKGVHTTKFCGDCLVQIDGSEEWDDLCYYNEDLTRDGVCSNLTIVKVSVPDEPANIFSVPTLKARVIWQRK